MQSQQLDDISLKNLDILPKDSGTTNVELAEKVHLSPSLCARRVKILEEEGYFLRKVTLLNPEKLGLNVDVFVQVSLINKIKEELVKFERQVEQWPEVMECYLMTGDFDYMLRLDLPNLPAYQQSLENKLTQNEGIQNIRSSVSLKQVRNRTEFDLAGLRGFFPAILQAEIESKRQVIQGCRVRSGNIMATY